ncbi:hypothetical protein CRUP_035106 [Coryphaenoides rupestris]|nr:hypothetical protein CRUP_035106 [Coryphaenoides rupestris]
MLPKTAPSTWRMLGGCVTGGLPGTGTAPLARPGGPSWSWCQSAWGGRI